MLRNSEKLLLRRATLNDSFNIMSWRNHENVRSHCVNSKFIHQDEHDKWFANILSSEQSILLIAELNLSFSVGVLRYDLNVLADEAEVSLYVVPSLIGQGWGKKLLREGEQWLKREKPSVKRITAKILPFNDRSIKLFMQDGFKKYIECYYKEI